MHPQWTSSGKGTCEDSCKPVIGTLNLQMVAVMSPTNQRISFLEYEACCKCTHNGRNGGRLNLLQVIARDVVVDGWFSR